MGRCYKYLKKSSRNFGSYLKLINKMGRMKLCNAKILIIALFSTIHIFPYSPVIAGCKTELRNLANDLSGVKLSHQKTQSLAASILMAREHCLRNKESESIELINEARTLAGLEVITGEFDWENVPIETLEENPN